MATESKLAVILHTDIVGSTALVQQDERVAHERIQDTFRRLAEIVSAYRGITHERRGDALVAEFARASDAICAALTFQRDNRKHNERMTGTIKPEARIGIAMGEVVVADRTVTGAGVVLAQRLEQLAQTGNVCISAATREAVPARLSLAYEDLGEHQLKGFKLAQKAYVVSVTAGEELPRPDAIVVASTPADRWREGRQAAIAVLPFKNLSSDPEQEYFADGMAEDVTTALSRFREFLVVARGTTFTFKGQVVDAPSVAKQLGVRYVVEGSVRRAGSRIRVTAQLIDAERGSHLWAERYDRSLADIFAVQDEVTEAVVTAIAPMIGRAEVERARRKPPASLDAWAQMQLGLSHLWTLREEPLDKAEKHLRRAVTIDPHFSVAHGWLAFDLFLRATLYRYQKERSLSDAKIHAREAIALDPDNAIGHVALGRVLTVQGNADEAIMACETSIALNPNFGIAHMGLGFALLYGKGDAAQALRSFDAAIRLSPRDPWRFFTHLHMGTAYRALGQYQEAVRHGQASCELGDAHPLPFLFLAASLSLADRQQEAKSMIRKALELESGLNIRVLSEGPQKAAHPNIFGPLFAGLRLAGFPEA